MANNNNKLPILHQLLACTLCHHHANSEIIRFSEIAFGKWKMQKMQTLNKIRWKKQSVVNQIKALLNNQFFKFCLLPKYYCDHWSTTWRYVILLLANRILIIIQPMGKHEGEKKKHVFMHTNVVTTGEAWNWILTLFWGGQAVSHETTLFQPKINDFIKIFWIFFAIWV